MSVIAEMLWVLESRSREPLDLEELASVTGRSKSYLSRVFPMVTGYSVTGYLRARRLSEAARILADGAPDILSVALDFGYGSHEAFTRAFRDHFGVTPQTVRQRRSLDGLALVEPLRMDTSTTTPVAPPRFENRPEMYFAGIAERHRMSMPAGIPEQWRRFQPYIGNIDGAIKGAAYGLVGEITEDGLSTTWLASKSGPAPNSLRTLRAWSFRLIAGPASPIQATFRRCARLLGQQKVG